MDYLLECLTAPNLQTSYKFCDNEDEQIGEVGGNQTPPPSRRLKRSDSLIVHLPSSPGDDGGFWGSADWAYLSENVHRLGAAMLCSRLPAYSTSSDTGMLRQYREYGEGGEVGEGDFHQETTRRADNPARRPAIVHLVDWWAPADNQFGGRCTCEASWEWDDWEEEEEEGEDWEESGEEDWEEEEDCDGEEYPGEGWEGEAAPRALLFFESMF
ncbi:hypothetical protein TWF481_009055 [Arthrobotrys musiformis]|uniref:Uncharacterized protein n=1 Tax=Arthrobotrys musiformis TaxID=47236 RepID=A0AAV9W8C8_9PEZI